jgi:precorrin-6Y C5,15-methyltransferase (decarboxylating)
MKPMLVIVSCGVSPADLTARHREAIASADVLAGGQRLLDWFPEFAGEKKPLRAHTRETVDELIARSRDARVVVLASGDALFFGVGRLFAERAQPEQLEILPNITAAQAALARLHQAWDHARFFSVHGRDTPLPWRAILQAPLAVVYADPTRTPSAIAAGLIERWPESSRRPAAAVCDLGGPAERYLEGTLAHVAGSATSGLALLVVRSDDASRTPPLPLGLDDETYEHEAGLITHPEIRAVVLAKLRLGPGVLWDVGAGSGSVGLEAAGLCEGLTVYALEKQAARCAQIRANAVAGGCPALTVVEGSAPDLLDGLPAPRSVFVGGGGASVTAIVEHAFRRLLPGGSLVASAVLLETRARLLECLPARRAELLELDVRRARPLGEGHRLEAANPISLFVYRKERE